MIKMTLKLLFCLLLGSVCVTCLPGSALLGAKECTWGPSYWCKNLTSAHSCKAVPHCIKTVWEHMEVPQDNDDICSMCKNMVGQARDQLESNQTMDEIKQVFDGTCKLIYIKEAVEICTKFADELVPELVDTLASQMNPDVICSVAGLCNNPAIDKAIKEHEQLKNGDDKPMVKSEGEIENDMIANQQQNCGNCANFYNQSYSRLSAVNSQGLQDYLLRLCGKTSSFSDSCASHVLVNFQSIESHLRSYSEKGDQLCFLSGSCSSTKKPDYVGDETCDLCQQLVLHFKDILTADTTEEEFRKVLRGICGQTKSFADECTALVDQYYDEIYKIITQDLDGKRICGFFEICPEPGVYVNGQMAPLLPAVPVPIDELHRVSVGDANVGVRVINDDKNANVRPTIAYGDPIGVTASPKIAFGDSYQTPFPLPPSLYAPMLPLHHDIAVNNQQTCIFCQYALHYLQKVITMPEAEGKIKQYVDEMCEKLPQSLKVQCEEFVDLYGDAAVALLAQEIDPSQVCPTLKICPAVKLADRYEIQPITGKPGCALCMMAISELESSLSDNKTEASIKEELDQLCSKLPNSLVEQCDDIVSTYTEQIVDMLKADFTPEEVCQFLKICTKIGEIENVPIGPGLEVPVEEEEPYEVRTNEIPNYEPEPQKNEKTLIYVQKPTEKPVTSEASPSCVLCEFVMQKMEDELKDNKTQDEIDHVLHSICDHLPKTVRKDCEKFVVKYAEEILNTLAMFVDPADVCSYIGLCTKSVWQGVDQPLRECAMCEAVFLVRKTFITGKDVKVDRVNFLTRSCKEVAFDREIECKRFMRRSGIILFNAIVENPETESLCHQLEMCNPQMTAKVRMEKRSELLGAKECTWGPGYWCKSKDHAQKCGAGALKHCQDKVWPTGF